MQQTGNAPGITLPNVQAAFSGPSVSGGMAIRVLFAALALSVVAITDPAAAQVDPQPPPPPGQQYAPPPPPGQQYAPPPGQPHPPPPPGQPYPPPPPPYQVQSAPPNRAAFGRPGPPPGCFTVFEQRDAIRSGRALPFAIILRSIRANNGDELLRARLCAGQNGLVYMVTLLSASGKVTGITVDARNGSVISHR